MTRAGTLNERGVGSLHIRLLGPIGAERDGEPVSVGGPRQRAVLSRLAIGDGRVVTVDRLVEDVWAGDPPTTAVNTLQSYVSLLRRGLGDPSLLRREGPGYVLAVRRDQLDVARFEDLVSEGLEAAARLLTAAVTDSVRHGLRAYLGRVLAQRTEATAQGEAELRRAVELAAELDLVLPASS